MSSPLNGSCFCQQTRYNLHPTSLTDGSSNLTMSAYCHCTGCQRMNGAPFIHTTHWKGHAVLFDGVEPARFEQQKGKFKLRCERCGSPIGTWSSKRDEYSIWPATLSRDNSGKPTGLDFMKPTCHIFYDTRVIDIDDGLPKWSEYEIKVEGKIEDSTCKRD